uniref:Innexin n=1 Tax=Ditylenchus dipsaci TaxID=166011 RepID=A0A915DUF0_9BILA
MTVADRRQEITKLVTYVNECLEINELHRAPRRILCFRVGRSLGSYVSTLYLCIKLMYLGNVFGQFVLLNSFIGRGYNMWGWTALTSLATGSGWTDSPVFPRVSLCDFRVRRLANMHRYTVQCVLMINMFNEKIYLYLVLVPVRRLVDHHQLLLLRAHTHSTSFSERTLRELLKQDKFHDITDSEEAAPMIERFTNHALRPDGVLLLRFIEGHAGALWLETWLPSYLIRMCAIVRMYTTLERGAQVLEVLCHLWKSTPAFAESTWKSFHQKYLARTY